MMMSVKIIAKGILKCIGQFFSRCALFFELFDTTPNTVWWRRYSIINSSLCQ